MKNVLVCPKNAPPRSKANNNNPSIQSTATIWTHVCIICFCSHMLSLTTRIGLSSPFVERARRGGQPVPANAAVETQRRQASRPPPPSSPLPVPVPRNFPTLPPNVVQKTHRHTQTTATTKGGRTRTTLDGASLNRRELLPHRRIHQKQRGDPTMAPTTARRIKTDQFPVVSAADFPVKHTRRASRPGTLLSRGGGGRGR